MLKRKKKFKITPRRVKLCKIEKIAKVEGQEEKTKM